MAAAVTSIEMGVWLPLITTWRRFVAGAASARCGGLRRQPWRAWSQGSSDCSCCSIGRVWLSSACCSHRSRQQAASRGAQGGG
jgi:hypothetical protein